MLRGFFFNILAATLLSSIAFAGPSLTYHGRLLSSSGTAVSGLVQVRLQIRTSGTENCLLYEEVESTTLVNGVFVVGINDGVGTVSNGNLSFGNVFSNRQNQTFAAGKCAVGTTYAASAADDRVLQLSFNDGTFAGWEDMPAQTISHVGLAINSVSVGGYPSTSLLRTAESDGTLVSTSPLSGADYTELVALVGGTSSKYMTKSTLEGVTVPTLSGGPLTLTAGKIWYEGGDLKYYDAVSATTKTLGASAGGGTVTASTSVTSPLVNGSATASGNITIDSNSTATKGNILLAPTGGKVGIGTTSPSYPLHVVQPTASTNIAYFRNDGNSTDLTIGASGASILIGSGAGDELQLYSHGTTSQGIRINTNGQVGVGTTSPGSPLHVYSTGNTALFGNRTTPLSTQHVVDIVASGTNTPLTVTGGSGSIEIWKDAAASKANAFGAAVPGNAVGDDFVFSRYPGSGWFETLRIQNSSGNVGIGTATPGKALDVVGDGRFSGILSVSPTTDNVDKIILNDDGTYQFGLRKTTSAGIQWFGKVGGTNAIFEATQRVTYNTPSSDVVRFGVYGGGNVGIGTTSPRAALDVSTGSITGKASVVNATSTVDFGSGNIQHTTASCGSFALWNLKDGGSYLFIVKGTTSATCSFTAYSDAGSTALTVHLPPGHGATTATKHTLYNAAVSGSDIYLSWVPGY